MVKQRWGRKKGSMIVEAAIVLPVYIIAVVTLCWLVKACFLEAAVFSTVVDQVHYASVSVTGSVMLQGDIRSALESTGVESSRYSQRSVETDLIAAGVGGFEKLKYCYDTSIKVPLPFVKEILLDNEIIYHNWDGVSYNGTPFLFSDMENDGVGTPILVFPRSGGRYHTSTCRYANAHPVEVTLTPEIREKYDRCRLCTEGDEVDGQKVYVFRYGGSYHEADCSSVDKYTIMMDIEDAKTKGYTACKICGGG